MSTSTAKICCVCNKDVSSAQRVKDAQGHYYCAQCHQAAAQPAPADHLSQTVHVSAQTKLQTPKPAPADDGIFDLAEPIAPPAPRPKPAPAAAAASTESAPVKLPENCPNCGAKVFAGRRLCVKCNRDVTQMDKLIAMRAAAAKDEKGEAAAKWTGWIVGSIGIAVAAGVIIVVLWGIKVLFMPTDPWGNFPTSREAVVREYLKDISDGTPKSYDSAFMLISYRERTRRAGNEDAKYKEKLKQMHDDFSTKYGADWLSKIKLENTGANEHYPDDEVDFTLTLDKDDYHIATQVQIEDTIATANMTMPNFKKPVYNEDGKLRFGILDVAEYKAYEKRHMEEMVGSSMPERLTEPGK